MPRVVAVVYGIPAVTQPRSEPAIAWILTTRGAPNTLHDGPHSADQLPGGFQSGEVAYMAAQRTSGRRMRDSTICMTKNPERRLERKP
jgi:hypothetical protein